MFFKHLNQSSFLSLPNKEHSIRVAAYYESRAAGNCHADDFVLIFWLHFVYHFSFLSVPLVNDHVSSASVKTFLLGVHYYGGDPLVVLSLKDQSFHVVLSVPLDNQTVSGNRIKSMVIKGYPKILDGARVTLVKFAQRLTCLSRP